MSACQGIGGRAVNDTVDPEPTADPRYSKIIPATGNAHAVRSTFRHQISKETSS